MRRVRPHRLLRQRATGHRYIQSFEPGEDWFFDYETGQLLSGPELAPPTARPEDQPTPGPAGRVPDDWRSHIHRAAQAVEGPGGRVP